MGGARTTDRGVPPAVQDRPSRPASHDRGDHLAARQRREMAPDPGRTGPVVDGGANLQPVVAPGRLGAVAGGGAAAWRDRGRDGVPRWHQHPGAPQGRRRGQKGGTSAQRDAREGLGRSRGGYGTKACVIADASGRAIGFALAPGQAHELPLAPLLLAVLSLIPAWIVGARGSPSHAFRDLIWRLGARPAIPAKRREAAVACPPWIYRNRNRVERLWARLKEWRAVATRYEKTACSFMGVLCMAATMDWIK